MRSGRPSEVIPVPLYTCSVVYFIAVYTPRHFQQKKKILSRDAAAATIFSRLKITASLEGLMVMPRKRFCLGMFSEL